MKHNHDQVDYIEYDYPFPNAIAIFWYFILPMILILILVLFHYRQEIWTLQLAREDLLKVIFVLITILFIVPILATLVANFFPALRVKPNGLEVRFYFPKLTKWIFLPWNGIDKLEFFSTQSEKLLRRRKSLFIYSKRLPFYYCLTALLIKSSFSRGVMIMSSIKNYDELLNLITLNKDKSDL